MPDVRLSPTGKFIEGVGVSALVTNVRYVDVGTSVPLAEQDGTLAAPFASMQDAFD